MTDENSTPKREGYLLKMMGFELGPPPGRSEAKAQEAEPTNGPSAKERTALSRAASLDALGRQFSTRLQLLWTYVQQIGSAAQSTSFANLAGVLALVNEIVESA